MKKITGIRKRWMVNSISVVLFIVLLAVAAFSAAMGSYYYSTLSESLKQKAENAISSFDYYRTEAEYYDNARAVVAGEPNSDKLEVQVEMTPEMFSDNLSKVSVREKELVDALKAMLGIYAVVKLVAPKSITRSVAEDAFRVMRELQQLYFTTVTITAKEKLCVLEKPAGPAPVAGESARPAKNGYFLPVHAPVPAHFLQLLAFCLIYRAQSSIMENIRERPSTFV